MSENPNQKANVQKDSNIPQEVLGSEMGKAPTESIADNDYNSQEAEDKKMQKEKQKHFDQLKWYYKNAFEKWSVITANLEGERFTFIGSKEEGNKTKNTVIVKQIEINENKYLPILREEYFLACCKRNKYFVEIIDSLLLKEKNEKDLLLKEKNEQDYKYNFLILRDEGVNLKKLIENPKIYYDKNNAESILFEVACGLKILHSHGLCHNDIKPGNILSTARGKVKICDMGSADKVSNGKYGGTNGYLSPQVLLGKLRTEKDDMWSLGIVFLELLKRKTLIFKYETKNSMKEVGGKALKYVLEKLYDFKAPDKDWNKITYIDIIKFIRIGQYNNFQYKLKDNILIGINDFQDKQVIENLLKIDPKERWSVQELLDSTLFKNLGYKFIDSDFKYSPNDYKKYLSKKPADKEEFIKFHEEIKQKYIGLSIFDKNDN